MKTVIEVINFLHELDLLEAHLDEHQHFINKTVIVESEMTYSGMHKPLIFKNNMDRFKRFNLQYECIPSDFFEQIPASYSESDRKQWHDARRRNREKQQNFIFNKYKKEADYICNTDVDEIWSRNKWDVIYNLIKQDYCYIAPVIKSFYFFIDSPGSSVEPWRITRNDMPTYLRQKGTKRDRTSVGVGWHFSSCYKDMKDLWYKAVGIAQSSGYLGWKAVPSPDELKDSFEKGIIPIWNQPLKFNNVMPKDYNWLPEFMRNNIHLYPTVPDNLRENIPIYEGFKL